MRLDLGRVCTSAILSCCQRVRFAECAFCTGSPHGAMAQYSMYVPNMPYTYTRNFNSHICDLKFKFQGVKYVIVSCNYLCQKKAGIYHVLFH
jgi:hypothetical protein